MGVQPRGGASTMVDLVAGFEGGENLYCVEQGASQLMPEQACPQYGSLTSY